MGKFRKNMLNSIAQNNFSCSDDGVVPGRLVKCNFCEWDVRCFTFHQNFRGGFFRYKQINPFYSTIQLDFLFKDKCRWISFFCLDKILEPVLPYPFFGGEQKPDLPYRIIDKKLIFVSRDLKIKIVLKIQFRKFHCL